MINIEFNEIFDHFWPNLYNPTDGQGNRFRNAYGFSAAEASRNEVEKVYKFLFNPLNTTYTSTSWVLAL